MRKNRDISAMKYWKLTLTLISVLFAKELIAESPSGGPHIVYDLGFDLRFDNREFSQSGFSSSGTIFGTRFYPTIGLETHFAGAVHNLIGGAEIRKDFGDINDIGTHLISDLFFYYNFENNGFTITGGVFPRSKCKEDWSTAFLSEKHIWYDPYIEGILFTNSGINYRIELGCDWMGMYGAGTFVKEQFMIFSAGHRMLGRYLKLGYNAYMVHFANSIDAPGVCDNILAEPFMELRFSELWFTDRFSLKLGYLQSLQRDRLETLDFMAPGLGEATVELARGYMGIKNSFYYGKDIMPLYSKTDSAGVLYANRLYFGDPFFRINEDGASGCGSYDRLELFYEKVLGGNLKIKASAVFHFNNTSFSGSQQIVSLSYDFGR